MGFFKTLITLVIILIVLIVGLPICIYMINDLENYSQNRTTEEPKYSYPTGEKDLGLTPLDFL